MPGGEGGRGAGAAGSAGGVEGVPISSFFHVGTKMFNFIPLRLKGGGSVLQHGLIFNLTVITVKYNIK